MTITWAQQTTLPENQKCAISRVGRGENGENGAPCSFWMTKKGGMKDFGWSSKTKSKVSSLIFGCPEQRLSRLH